MALGRFLRRTLSRLSTLGRSRALDQDLEDELRNHVEAATAEHVARGLPPDAARRAALAALGGFEASKERLRDVRRPRLVDELGQDLRYGVRTLLRARGFTVVALSTLAIGIGANTAVFTVVNGTLLRPMPFFEPDRLYAAAYAPVAGPFRPGPAMLDADFVPFRQAQTVFGAVAASELSSSGMTLTGLGDPVRLRRASVTPNYFATLGVTPRLGRPFGPGEADPGRDHVVLIGAALWRGRLGADPNVTARSLRLDGADYRIVGVAPDDFAFPHRAEVWTPLDVRLEPGRVQFLEVIGRLNPMTTPAAADAAVKAFISQQPRGRLGMPTGPDWVARTVPAADLVVAKARLPIQVFAGAVAFVLLIACANVANLLLVRASGRARELAVRAALGAERARLVRQLLTESLLLALIGAVLGLLVAAFGVRELLALAPLASIPRPDAVRIDGGVLAVTAGVAILTGLGFGLLPALQATRPAARQALRTAGRGATAGGERVRAVLAAAEIALALVLMAGGTLLLKSFARLEAVDPGFQTDHRLVAAVSFPAATYQTPARVQAFHADVLRHLSTIDGVAVAASVNNRPLGNNWTIGDLALPDGRQVPADWIANKVSVSADYFRAMGIALVAGREFTPADDRGASPVAIISESIARAFWPKGNAVGQQVASTEKPTAGDWLTIVGVARDVRQRFLDKSAEAALYQPVAQTADLGTLNHTTFVVRATGDPTSLVSAMRAAIRAADPTLPIETLATLPDLVSATTATPRFQTWLVGTFALIAVGLAAIGVSGVLSYSVSQRTREIGIRLALGATTPQILGLVVRRTLAVAGAGITVGLATAWLLTRVLGSVLFEIEPHDPWAFAAAVSLLVLVALGAAVGPAWRARSVSPMVACQPE